MRCRVGSGTAVLCGTHPELGPEWLDPCGESNAAQGPRPHPEQPPAAAAESKGDAPGQASPQQHLQQCVVAAGVQLQASGVLDSAKVLAAAGSLEGDQGLSQQSMPVVCRDVALAAHTLQLKSDLQAAQEGRDLLLASLLYEALVRQH